MCSILPRKIAEEIRAKVEAEYPPTPNQRVVLTIDGCSPSREMLKTFARTLSGEQWKQIRKAVRKEPKPAVSKTRCQDAHLVDWLEG